MPRKFLLASLFVGVSALPAVAENSSTYTDLDADRDCTVFARAEDGEGDWADLVCTGYRGYPVFLYYSDARESLFYGFPPAGDLAPVWESFDAFNEAGPRIEWRLEAVGDRKVPFATIHRWFVDDPERPGNKTEVLVVEKIGQPHERDGCAVGYVVATGNSKANEQARRIADERARKFACGSDKPEGAEGNLPVPTFIRQE